MEFHVDQDFVFHYNSLGQERRRRLDTHMDESHDNLTSILAQAAQGDQSASEELLPLVYDRLRALAGSFFRRERPDHTLQPTALANDVYLQLLGREGTDWQSRAHFFAIAARAMRQMLTDHARRKKAEKRGGDQHRVTLSGLVTPPDVESEIDLVDLDRALTRLAETYPEQARIVEMRFLVGLTIEEVAYVLGTSTPTVVRRWRMARAWLRRELAGDAKP